MDRLAELKRQIAELEPKKALRIAARFAVIAGLSLVLASCGSEEEALKNVRINITHPSDNEIVPHIGIVDGTVENLPRYFGVCVLITDSRDHMYHPRVNAYLLIMGIGGCRV